MMRVESSIRLQLPVQSHRIFKARDTGVYVVTLDFLSDLASKYQTALTLLTF